MSRIVRVLAVPVAGGYWAEDLTVLQSRPMAAPDRYTAQPVTSGFDAVRQAAEGVSVGLVLDDSRVAWGDCVGVAYGGKSGRDPVFRSRDGLATIERAIAPFFQGRELTGFRELAAEVDALTESVQVTQKKRVDEGIMLLQNEMARTLALLSTADP